LISVHISSEKLYLITCLTGWPGHHAPIRAARPFAALLIPSCLTAGIDSMYQASRQYLVCLSRCRCCGSHASNALLVAS